MFVKTQHEYLVARKCEIITPFVVSLSNHNGVLRQAQDERNNYSNCRKYGLVISHLRRWLYQFDDNTTGPVGIQISKTTSVGTSKALRHLETCLFGIIDTYSE